MSTQLRLVDPPEEAPAAAPASSGPRTGARDAPRNGGRVRNRASAAGPSRRAAHWGDWRLDDRTRRVGRAGVAAARRALEEAQAAEALSRAS